MEHKRLIKNYRYRKFCNTAFLGVILHTKKARLLLYKSLNNGERGILMDVPFLMLILDSTTEPVNQRCLFN